jgi:threo-3-hydroxy-L-aspartate ammonia-lyase
LAGLVRQTPVLTDDRLDTLLNVRLFLKAEHRQYTGSFKIRGALNRMLGLTPSELGRGVIAGSSGNHGKAVAAAARHLGASAMIVIPDDAPEAKHAAIKALGAVVVAFDRAAVDRDVLVDELAGRHGYVPLPSSNDTAVLIGNGSAAAELIEQVPDLDVLVVPVGGGGLAAGCGLAAQTLAPSLRVVGVEPLGADDTARSLRAGIPVTIAAPSTIADGLRHRAPGSLTFPILQRVLYDLFVVSDEHIIAAMRLLYAILGDTVEPSGACAMAAVLAHPSFFAGQRLGVLLTGGNIDRTTFCALTR